VKVYGWVERFKGRPKCFDECSGRSSTEARVEVKGQIDQSIRDNRKISIHDNASESWKEAAQNWLKVQTKILYSD
jgi:hypothetical protein